MSSVLCCRTQTADQHLVSQAEHLQGPVVFAAELLKSPHIHQGVELEFRDSVMLPDVGLTVGDPTGHTGLHCLEL